MQGQSWDLSSLSFSFIFFLYVFVWMDMINFLVHRGADFCMRECLFALLPIQFVILCKIQMALRIRRLLIHARTDFKKCSLSLSFLNRAIDYFPNDI